MAYTKTEKDVLDQDTQPYYNSEEIVLNREFIEFRLTRYTSQAHREAGTRDKKHRQRGPALEFSGPLAQRFMSASNLKRAWHGFLERLRYGMGIPESWAPYISGDVNLFIAAVEGASPVLDGSQKAETPMKETEDEEVPDSPPAELSRIDLRLGAG